MKIRMTKDTLVAPDGFTVANWAAGEVREVSEQLGKDLIGAKRAELAKASEPAIAEEADEL